MNLRDCLDILRRRWLTTCVVALVVLGTITVTSLMMTPRYTSTVRLFFAVQGTDSVADLAQGSSFTEKHMTSYAQVASSPLVLSPVIEELGLGTSADTLAESLTVQVLPNTVILELSFTDPDPVQAADVTNAVGRQLAEVVENLSPARTDGNQAVKATILAAAQPTELPSSPNIPRNVAVGLLLGLLLGVGVAFLQQLLDVKVRTDRDVRATSDKPLLGAIALDDKVARSPTVVTDEPLSAPSEAIRRLRTNLQFIDTARGTKSVVVTSSIPGEGKSTTAVNLAVSLATAGARVLLIDADLRRPAVAECLGLEGRAGLTSVLIGRADVESVTQRWGDTSLYVLPSGQIPPNPSELLGSHRMRQLLTEVSDDYDIVLLDSPPVLPVTDSTVLTKLAHGALMVVGADRVHRGQLTEALATLETAGATVFGTVLNKIARRDALPYVYDSGYYAQPNPEESRATPPRRAAAVPERADR